MKQPPITPWLALWNIVESAVAVMVGCGPGLYRKAKSVNRSTSTFALEAGRYVKQADGSRSRRSVRNRAQLREVNEIAMEPFPVTTISKSESRHADGGSKEELVRKVSQGQITVTRSVRISRTREDSAALCLPTSYWSDTVLTRPKRRSQTATNARLRGTGRVHDRFVSAREIDTPLSDRYRTIKEPHELSAEERLTRTAGARTDPFRVPPRPDYLALRDRRTSRSDGHSQRPRSTVLALSSSNGASDIERQVSAGSVWTIGGMPPSGGGMAVDTGRGLLLESGTNATLFRAPFASGRPKSSDENERHEARLTQALDINRAQRVLAFDNFSTFPRCKKKAPGRHFIPKLTTTWTGTEWINEAYPSNYLENMHSIPNEPFRVLDATGLRDDYYCSVMAFCPNCDVIAVGLGNFVYGWSETSEVSLLSRGPREGGWVSSLSFSSEDGLNSILACGRANGTVNLLSLLDSEGADELPPVFKPSPRFEAQHARAVASLSWSPVPTTRPSLNPNNPGVLVQTENLLVGEDVGDVYYYSVEWPCWDDAKKDDWRGSMTLLACIKGHSQQICGLAWSPNATQFATGGNDNLCCLYSTETIADSEPVQDDTQPGISTFQWSAASESSVFSSDSVMDELGTRDVVDFVTPLRNSRPAPAPPTRFNASTASWTPRPLRSSILSLRHNDTNQHNNLPGAVSQASIILPKMYSRAAALKVWRHQAAVKALAFCPWLPSLLATGGGSTDKMIHFFHTGSGAALATISVSAQVTSLTWSTTRRELAATFGYAQPEHSIRIAVFSWPECTMIGCVRWHGEHRALCAIAYPGGPRGLHSQEDAESELSSRRGIRRMLHSRRKSKSKRDGCLVVAGSDESVKFHEVWGMGTGALSTSLGPGALGGSDILEMTEGIDKEGEVIR
ncbi:WD domain-containing protein [Apiospora saccharicola]